MVHGPPLAAIRSLSSVGIGIYFFIQIYVWQHILPILSYPITITIYFHLQQVLRSIITCELCWNVFDCWIDDYKIGYSLMAIMEYYFLVAADFQFG